MTTLTDQLVLVARIFAEAKGLSQARVSTLVLNRGATLALVESGRADVNTRTLEGALQWFSDRWPAGSDWPDGVPRPDPRVEPEGRAAEGQAAEAAGKSLPPEAA